MYIQVIEAMADGGVMMGLPRALAVEHAAATVRGAATMVLQESNYDAILFHLLNYKKLHINIHFFLLF